VTDRVTSPQTLFRGKIEQHIRLVAELGEVIERRCDTRESTMPPVTSTRGPSLAELLGRAIPVFADMGIEMEIMDISTEDVDGALEIMRTCPCLEASNECGLTPPSSVLCHLEVETNRRALPGTDVRPLARRVDDGSCICIFKYERPRARTESRRT
jgi:hypothetical protein